MGIRIRLSSREAASIRICLTSRINNIKARIKNDGTSFADQNLLTHLVRTFNRLHKATYGKDLYKNDQGDI